MCMFIFSFGGAFSTILKILFNINNTGEFMQEGSSCLEIMPVDAEQEHAEIGNFNGCLHYAVIKLKLSFFHIMTSESQVLVFLPEILIQCISKDNTASCFVKFFIFIMSPVVSELTLHAVCVYFNFSHLTKQIFT